MNIRFYGASTASWAQIISIVWVWIMIIVLMAGQYFFPLLWQQDDMSIKMVLRNAFILALRHPLYTFLMFLFQVLLLVVSFVTVLPIFLLTPAAVVLAMNFSLVGLLQGTGSWPRTSAGPDRCTGTPQRSPRPQITNNLAFSRNIKTEDAD